MTRPPFEARFWHDAKVSCPHCRSLEEQTGGKFVAKTVPFWRNWMGDEDISCVNIMEEHALTLPRAKIDEAQKLLPEATISIIVYPTPSDPMAHVHNYTDWRASHPDQ